MRKTAAFLVLMFITSFSLFAVTTEFAQTEGFFLWGTDANWTNGVPGINDTAVIPQSTGAGLGVFTLLNQGAEAIIVNASLGAPLEIGVAFGSISVGAAGVVANATGLPYTLILTDDLDPVIVLTEADTIFGNNLLNKIQINGSINQTVVPSNLLIQGNVALNSALNSYTGDTILSGALLEVNSNASLGISGDVNFTGDSTLNFSAGFTLDAARSIAISPAVTATFQTALTSIIAGDISGATGNLAKSGSGDLTLSGVLSYGGTTTLTAGTLVLAPTTPANFSLGGGSGAGDLVINNPGFTTTLAGIPSNSGSTTLTAGTLALAPSTPADISLTGNITGAGSLSVTNSGFTTTLSGATLDYAGATTLIRGTLNLPTGKTLSASDVVINSGANPITDAILTGEGTITGSLTVTKGTVLPGSSSTTQLNVGPYTQTADGKLKIVITPDSASKLVVTGDAALDGDLELEIGAGSYPDETTFEVLNTSGVLNGTAFATLTETHIGPWEIGYLTDNIVNVFLPISVVVTPVPISSLKGNERIMGDYMYGDPNFVTSNADLNKVSDAMLALSPGDFESALLEVSSVALTALPVVDLQNNIQMAVILDKQYKKTINNSRNNPSQSESKAPCFAIPHTGLFIEPIGLYYNQRQADGSLSDTGQIPFESFTYGAGLGWEQVLGDHFIVEGGVGYTYSTLNWKDDFGNANWNSIYVAPFFGWFNARAFANFMVLGAFNFHDTKRKISFSGFYRVAKSRYHSYNLLVRVNGGYRLPLKKNFWFQPEGTVNYLTVFTDAYTEKDAGSINLQVKDKTTYILQPSFRARFTKEFLTNRFCYAPTLYAGWLANIPLNGDNVAARFVGAPTQTFFNMQGYDQTTNQLILGAEFYMKRLEKFELTGDFEVDMLSQFEVYVLKVKFQWMF